MNQMAKEKKGKEKRGDNELEKEEDVPTKRSHAPPGFL